MTTASNDSLKARCRTKLDELLVLAREQYGYSEIITLRFDLRGCCAGQAMLKSRVMRLNLDAGEYLVENCVAHELAHFIAHEVFKDRGHGRRWQMVARSLGCNGMRCHTLDLPPARRTKKYIYTLPTGRAVEISAVRHKAIQKGRTYIYRATGERLSASCAYQGPVLK